MGGDEHFALVFPTKDFTKLTTGIIECDVDIL